LAQSERLSGTVTFLFTDIEGSTNLLKQLGRAKYAELLARQQQLVREAFTALGGEEIDTQGDSFFVAFRSAPDAVAAAVAIQRSVADHEWPDGVEVLVRSGIHTGEAAAAGERYVGFSVHKAARIGNSAHGGQVLLSDATRALVEDDLPPGVFVRDLGLRQLKDVDRPERIWQVGAEGLRTEFPPPRGAGKVKAPLIRRRSALAPALVVVIAAAVAIPVFAVGGGSSSSALAAVEGNAAGVVDSHSGQLTAAIPVKSAPASVTFGAGSIWMTSPGDDTVVRIDPTAKSVIQTIPVGNGPVGIAYDGRFIWVANSLDGTVSQIDPRQDGGAVVHKTTVGNGPTGVTYGERAVWVTNSTDGTVTRIDPGTGQASPAIAVDAGADAIAAGDGAVWVTGEAAGKVSKIDPKAMQVIDTVGVGSGPAAIAIGTDGVWVANSQDDTVSRIDPGTDAETEKIQVGDNPSGVAVSADGRTVWVTNELGGTLSRIDVSQNKVDQTVATGSRPVAVDAGKGEVYFAVQTAGLAHRGGTVTVAEAFPLAVMKAYKAGLLDPAQNVSWDLLPITNDGLTAYKRAAGSENGRVVPDLATSLPTPTDGGRTYTFQVRPGIRYSTGELVRPADFRRAIERVLTLPGAYSPAYWTGIVGASQCLKSPKKCDLSKGIVIGSDTITFHLNAPDPDFLGKLALSQAFAIPANTPLQPKLPLPATGPYMIDAFDSQHGVIRLVRNPRFQESAPAAQPDGYPDTIIEKFGYTNPGALAAVEHGTAQLTGVPPGSLPAAGLAALRIRYGQQLHVTPQASTFTYVLNTRLAPFNNLKVRQAVNYAVDRRVLVRFRNGIGLPTCQVLAPTIFGYQRYCPYTVDVKPNGSYSGPDVARARQLVAASGTRGEAVQVWKPADEKHGSDLSYLVSVLDSLGYRARLKPVKTLPANLSHAQAYWIGWGTDYPSASGYLSPIFTCADYKAGNWTGGGFCDPSIDTQINAALSQQDSDPQRAATLWRRIEQEIVGKAPWVPLLNPEAVDLTSSHVGNYIYNRLAQTAYLDQLWVR
jgi:YVTN family beta-propeller protein